jgi:hypothetical protein
VGALSIEASLKKATGFGLAVPLVLLSVPVFDTTMAIARRMLTGRAIGEGDRLHIHHRLQARGLSRAQSLLVISGLCTAMAVATLLSARYESDVVALGLCGFLLALLVYGRVFGYEETLLFLRGLRDTAAAVATYAARGDVRRVLRTISAENAESDDVWESATQQLERLGVRRLELAVKSARGEHRSSARRLWTAGDAVGDAAGWRVVLSLPRSSGILVEALASGSISSTAETLPLDVLRILAALCRHWPESTAMIDDVAGSSVIPLRPADETGQNRLRRVA